MITLMCRKSRSAGKFEKIKDNNLLYIPNKAKNNIASIMSLLYFFVFLVFLGTPGSCADNMTDSLSAACSDHDGWMTQGPEGMGCIYLQVFNVQIQPCTPEASIL